MSDNAELPPKEYVTIIDCAKKWKITSDKIKKFCEEGKIAGASKLNDSWIIPSNAEKPADTEKPIIENSFSLGKVIPKNKLQEAALRHIEEGVPFDVDELTIDGKTFIVSSVFKRQGPTLGEAIASLMMRDIERQTGGYYSVEATEEIRREIRKNSNAAKATFDDYIYTYRERLKKYGFSDDDIEILLEKIASDYEPFIL